MNNWCVAAVVSLAVWVSYRFVLVWSTDGGLFNDNGITDGTISFIPLANCASAGSVDD